MFENVDWVHGCFIQYAILKVVLDRFRFFFLFKMWNMDELKIGSQENMHVYQL